MLREGLQQHRIALGASYRDRVVDPVVPEVADVAVVQVEHVMPGSLSRPGLPRTGTDQNRRTTSLTRRFDLGDRVDPFAQLDLSEILGSRDVVDVPVPIHDRCLRVPVLSGPQHLTDTQLASHRALP